MSSQPLKVIALALVSLGAACTSSEPIKRGLDGESGVAATPASPFKPYDPSIEEPPFEMPVGVTGPGSGGAAAAPAATGGGGTGGAPAGACMGGGAVGPPPPGMHSPFTPDLGGAVTIQDRAPKPISGGTLLVLRDGSAAVVSDPDFDRVYVVDLATRAVRATLRLEQGAEPGRLVEDAAGKVHVVLRSLGQIARLDPTSGESLGRGIVCAAPRGLAYEDARDLVHVACAEGRLVSLHAGDFSRVRDDVAIDQDARDVVSLPDGGLLVSTFRRADALVLDANGNLKLRKRPPNVMRPPMPIPQPMSPAVAWRMVADQSGGAVMVHQRGVDGPISPTPGGYGGFGKGCGGIVESVVSIVAPGTTPVAPAPAIQMSTLAVDVALSPDGKQLAIASAGNAHTNLPQVQLASLDQVQAGAPGNCMGGSDAVGAPATGQVVAVSYAANGTLYVQMREPARLWSTDGTAAIPLSADTLADTGHLIFHANSGSGIACASCHPEGGEDGRTWNFACLGQRRTQSLRGRLSETAPFHWDGDMTSFPKLVKEVFVGRMSGPETTDAQNDALKHWLDQVPDLPVLPPGDAGAAERGRALFQGEAKCGTCHLGTHLTNNVTVDVGTGLPLQVPSLRGVRWRAPFLHDGSAAALADRFGPTGGGDKHGKTSQLKPADIKDLIAYLETL